MPQTEHRNLGESKHWATPLWFSRGIQTRLGLLIIAVLIALIIAMPLLAVVFRASGAEFLSPAGGGDSTANLQRLLSTVLPGFMVNTLLLALGVLAVVLLAGIGSAWLVAAYEFPLRRILSRLLFLPLAFPAFVMAYAYTDFLEVSGPLQSAFRAATGLTIGSYYFPDIRSLPGASIILGLSLFPYVYMLARPAFAERSAALAEAAQSLGVRPSMIWWRVTLPVARPAIIAGCALVLMETLADFGTVSYFAIDTLSAGIYRTWQGLGDQVSAARLSLMLMTIVLLLLWVERKQRGRMVSHQRQSRRAARVPLRSWPAIGAAAFCLVWVVVGFVIPTGLLIHGAWSALRDGEIEMSLRVFGWFFNSTILAASGTVLIIPAAILVAYACRLRAHPLIQKIAQFAASGYAIPGLVLAVGLLLLARALDQIGLGFLRATIALVLLAYLARFFAVAFQGINAGLDRIAPSMDHSARSLGASPTKVLRRVHWPLLRPTIGAATLLVFVDCLKELPATLVLRPFNFDTLAVTAYQFASDERLAAAAVPALGLLFVGLIPTLWLARDQSKD